MLSSLLYCWIASVGLLPCGRARHILVEYNEYCWSGCMFLDEIPSLLKLSWLVSTHSSIRRLTVLARWRAIETAIVVVGLPVRTFIVVNIVLTLLCVRVLASLDDAGEVVLPIAPLALDAAVDLQGILWHQWWQARGNDDG